MTSEAGEGARQIVKDLDFHAKRFGIDFVKDRGAWQSGSRYGVSER